MATGIQNQQSSGGNPTKKTKRTVVRNFVKEFDNAKIDPTWMRNRKGGSQVEDMEGQEEERAKLEEAWRKSDMMEEEAANKRKGQEQTNEAIQEAGTSWSREREWEQEEGSERNASGRVVVWKFGVCKKKERQHTAILEMDKCCQEEVEELWKEVACRMEIEVQNHWGIAEKGNESFHGKRRPAKVL